MIIPHQMLSPEALQGVIEAFVTREGTDYGIQDVSLATKILQVRQQLDAGTAVLVYDEDTESCTIQPTNQLSDRPRSPDRPHYAFRGGLSGAGASSTDSSIAANIERGF
jgi:hypothetical protein